jgi:L-histidine N-alpha-methyltransferase
LKVLCLALAVRDLRLEVDFAVGEELRTEWSAKFRRGGVESELRAAGLELVRWWTDAHGDFALALARVQQGVGR